MQFFHGFLVLDAVPAKQAFGTARHSIKHIKEIILLGKRGTFIDSYYASIHILGLFKQQAINCNCIDMNQ